jgi:hypothetical protein
MSDSGSTQLPPSSGRGDVYVPSPRAEIRGQVEGEIPPDIQKQLQQAVRARGEVVPSPQSPQPETAQPRSDVVRVRTEAGDIEVKLPPQPAKQLAQQLSRLPEGRPVEIELRPGGTVLIRPLVPQSSPSAPPVAGQAASPLPASLPVDLTLSTRALMPSSSLTPPGTDLNIPEPASLRQLQGAPNALNIGQIVRLTELPPLDLLPQSTLDALLKSAPSSVVAGKDDSGAAKPQAVQGGTIETGLQDRLVTGQKFMDVQIANIKGDAPVAGKPIAPLSNSTHIISAEVTSMSLKDMPVLSFTPSEGSAPKNFVMQFPAENLNAGMTVDVIPLNTDAQSTAPSGGQNVAPQNASQPFSPLVFFTQTQWFDLGQMIDLDPAQAANEAAQAAARMVSNALPQAARPAQLPATAMFFLSALRGGDVSAWMGDKALDALRRIGKGDSIERLARDFGGVQRSSAETGGADWRATALPMMWENEVSKVMLFYKHDRDSENDGGDGARKGTRFIFDLQMTRMGAVQIDGYTKGQKLDMILRTEKLLSAPMMQFLRGAYVDSLEQIGFKGELSFQGKRNQFVDVDLAGLELRLS